MEQLAREFSDYSAHLSAYWKNENLWTWRWWLSIVLTVAPWVFWFFIRNKHSTCRLLTAAFFVSVVCILFDTAGIVSGLWQHPVKVAPLPMFSCVFPWDYSVLPVSVMLFLQIFPRLNPFLKAAVFALSGAFIVHPLAIWFGYLKAADWVILALFPLLFVLYLLAHVIAHGRHFERI